MAELENDVIFRLRGDGDDLNSELKKSENNVSLLNKAARNFGTETARASNRAERGVRGFGRTANRQRGILRRLRNTGRTTFRALGVAASAASKVIAASFAAATAGLSLLFQALGGVVALLGAAATTFATLTINSTETGRSIREDLTTALNAFKGAAQEILKDIIPIGIAVLELFRDLAVFISESFVKAVGDGGQATESFGVRAAAAIATLGEINRTIFGNIGDTIRIFIQRLRVAAFALEDINSRLNPFDGANERRIREGRLRAEEQIDLLQANIRNRNINVAEAFEVNRERFAALGETLNGITLDFGRSSGRSLAKGFREGSIAALKAELSELQKELSNNTEIGDVNTITQISEQIVDLTNQIEEAERQYQILRNQFLPLPAIDVDTGKIAEDALKVIQAQQAELAKERAKIEEEGRKINESLSGIGTSSEFRQNNILDQFIEDNFGDLSGFGRVQDQVDELVEKFREAKIGPEEFADSLRAISTQQLTNTLGDIGSSFGSLSQIFEEGSKAQEVALKAQAIATLAASAANVQLALTQAASIPFPGNLVAVPAVLGLIANIVQTARSFKQEQEQGFYEGTEYAYGTPSQNSKRDGIPARIHKGERVTPTKLNDRIRKAAGGKLGNQRMTEIIEQHFRTPEMQLSGVALLGGDGLVSELRKDRKERKRQQEFHKNDMNVMKDIVLKLAKTRRKFNQ